MPEPGDQKAPARPPRLQREEAEAAADALLEWIADPNTRRQFDNIGMTRITAIWFAAWEAALRTERPAQKDAGD